MTTTWDIPAEPVSRPVSRPGWVTAAAVILLTMAALSALMALGAVGMAFAMGSVWSDMMRAQMEAQGYPDSVSVEAMGGIMTGLMAGMGAIVLLWAVGNGAAGIGILGGRGWARITGLVVSVIGLVFTGLGLLFVLWATLLTAGIMEDPQFQELYGSGAYGAYGSEMAILGVGMLFVFALPFVIGYAIILVVLIRNGAYFRR